MRKRIPTPIILTKNKNRAIHPSPDRNALVYSRIMINRLYLVKVMYKHIHITHVMCIIVIHYAVKLTYYKVSWAKKSDIV